MADKSEHLDESKLGGVNDEAVVEESKQGVLTDEEINRRIQSAVDQSIAKTKREYEQKLKDKEAELSEVKKAQMSEEERRKAELEEIETTRKAVMEERRSLLVSKALVAVGLDPERFAKRIHGTTDEEIRADAQELKEYLDSVSHTLAEDEVKKKLTVNKPEGGKTPGAKLTEAEIEKLPTREERQKARREAGLIV